MCPEGAPKQPVPIPSDNRFQLVAPFVSAVHVAGTKGATLEVVELVEDE